ncbi:hypothetical protein HDV05_008033 [Chytridiales sp. JEL 0842]|nr:hypothetical protein HDV05_008033 [Chytridiales sp. JEL 0842]
MSRPRGSSNAGVPSMNSDNNRFRDPADRRNADYAYSSSSSAYSPSPSPMMEFNSPYSQSSTAPYFSHQHPTLQVLQMSDAELASGLKLAITTSPIQVPSLHEAPLSLEEEYAIDMDTREELGGIIEDPTYMDDLRSLRNFYTVNCSRMKEEAELLAYRSQRLMRLGVDPLHRATRKIRSEVRRLSEKLPWKELTVAVIGPQGAGKSSVLSKIVGRQDLFGNAVTSNNYAFAHANAAGQLSPRKSKSGGRGLPLVVVSHQMDRLENVVYIDTAPLDIPHSTLNPHQNDTAESLSFPGLNINDPAVTGVTISADEKESELKENSSRSPQNSANDSPVQNIVQLLQAEAVDVVMYVAAPGEQEISETRNMKSAFSVGTLPVVVANKVDNVWDELYINAKGDEDFIKDYSNWKDRFSEQSRSASNIPDLTHFFVSTARDSSINGVNDLEGFLSQLVKHRKTVKTLTGLKHLDAVATSYVSVVNSHINQLKEVQVFFDEILRLVEDRVDVASHQMRHLFAGAVIKAFYSALRDVGLDDVTQDADTDLLGAFTDSNTSFITLDEAKRRNDPYLIARCLELGLGIASSRPFTDSAAQSPRASPSTSPTPKPRSTHPLATSFSPKTDDERSKSRSSKLHMSDNRIRSEVTQLYSSCLEKVKTGSSLTPDDTLPKAALRLSHIFRPSSEKPEGDPAKSMKYLKQAAAMGSVAAQVELGRAREIGDCDEINLKDALKWYKAAADSGDSEAALEMARFSAAGLGGIQANAETAVSWLMRAAGGSSRVKSKTCASIAAIIGYQASVEISRCYLDGVGVQKDDKEAVKWRKESERRWELVWTMLGKTMWNLVQSKALMRTSYSMGSFVDRLQDQLRLHIAVVRTHLVASINATLPPLPPTPVGFEDPSSSHVNSAPAPASAPKPTPFQNVQSLIVHQLVSALQSWTTGNVDEEADIKREPSANVSSALAEAVQSALTVAIPGTAMTSLIAEGIVRLWSHETSKFEIVDEHGDDPTAVSDEDILMSPYQRRAQMDVDPVPEMEEDPYIAVGLALIQFLKAVTQPGYISEPGSAKVFGSLLGAAWDTSVDRMLLEIQNVFQGFVDAIKKESRIWSKRQTWASSVSMECQSKLASMKGPVLKSVLNSISEARKASATTASEGRMTPTAEKTGDTTWNGIEISRISQMPFVWGGATVIMSSQLLDEVTGSLHQISWDSLLPESGLPTIPSSNPVIDELLDQGVDAYRSPNSSKINAISVWQEALSAAESCGDLIRESNALSNMGCACRMIGRFPASLSYLALAWYKACSYAVRATSAVPNSIAVDIIRQSLSNDLVSVDSGAAHLPGRNTEEVVPTDWSFAKGPSLVIWFTRLVINLGHANLSVGRVDLAGEWYQAGIRLCENTLLRYPVPPQPPLPKDKLKLKASSQSSTMSYLHKSTLLSYVRALAHRGLCHAATGQMSDAIDKQNLALFILSLHGPHLGEPESTYKAAIEANLGNIYHTQGRLGAAVAHHAKSAMLFLQIDDLNAHARELGNLGALWIEIGKSLRELEWVKESNATFSLALDQVNGNGGQKIVKRKRSATKEDIEKNMSKQFKVLRDFEKRPNQDLDINLQTGDTVSIIMVMDDGVSALGQKGEQQGTFLFSYLEVEEEIILPSPANVQANYTDLMNAVAEIKSLTNSRPTLQGLPAKPMDTMHCGTSYVEFGLGILKDVLNLGVDTAELSINIAAGENLLHQPYRAIKSLLRLVDGSKGTGAIPSTLRKQLMLNLSAAFLMVAFINEDESTSKYWPDGTEKYGDSELITDMDLDNLLSSLGISANIRLSHLSRADVFPVLQACVDTNENHMSNEFDNILVSGPLSALGSSILGTLEWVTSVWIMDVDPEEGMQWRNRGIMRVLEATEKQSIAVKIAKDGPTQPTNFDIDNPEVGGDGSVFTIAAGLSLLQSSLSPASFTAPESEVGLIDATLGDGTNFAVWSWATNNSRVQVCAKCAPRALHISMQGHAEVSNSGSSVEPFPCVHLKTSQEKPIAVSPEIRLSLIPGGRASVKKDAVAMAAGDILGAMVRRATKGRLKELEKNVTWESDEKKSMRRKSILFKEPLAWRKDAKSSPSPGEEKDMVILLKRLALNNLNEKGSKDMDVELEREVADVIAQKASQFNQLDKAQWEWINLFYRDAAASMKLEERGEELPEYSVVDTV